MNDFGADLAGRRRLEHSAAARHQRQAGRLRYFDVVLRGGGNLTYRVKPVENRTEAQQRPLANWLKQ